MMPSSASPLIGPKVRANKEHIGRISSKKILGLVVVVVVGRQGPCRETIVGDGAATSSDLFKNDTTSFLSALALFDALRGKNFPLQTSSWLYDLQGGSDSRLFLSGPYAPEPLLLPRW